ncbi:sodium-dependent transporter [Corynebacterium sp. 4HC-13]|uniref:sodium-dependent transporter n=1 Tax=Corynebacterium anserum TaxID=2684406 RepID=UPI001639F9AA|nr:sodium-dependent transporter [Corynebacterium anserum]MBC2681952.1 sodium-dependent transporter [Corynebacterium anserum]
MANTTQKSPAKRETFNSRLMFMMAAIGSAVGLGNIWRFPYVTYDNGGGAFLIPYLVALLTAGIPILWFDFAIGHRYRASAPLAFRRMARWAEPIGWFKAGVAFFIAIYYAAILAWAGLYTVKSFNQAWGDDPESYLMNDFLKMDSSSTFSGDFVLPILVTLIAVWIFAIAVLAMNVNKGIGSLTLVFVPVLIILFVIMVVRALFLDGALEGLNAFFTPDWSALSNTSVWIAAYGQIFFSLSVGFGIMITYASYLKPRSNLTGTGMTTAFANSSFEVLAGIGVFATLGFMSVTSHVAVGDVASGGIGLAFIAFPTIINQMPMGALFGVMFFGSLFLAGITSLISIMEVVFAALSEKLGWNRATTAIVFGTIMAVLSTVMFASTSSLVILDIMDKWTNNLGIVFCAAMALLIVAWVTGRRNEIAQHLNAVSSIRVGRIWEFCAFILTPVALIIMMFNEIKSMLAEPYGGYSSAQLNLFGWGTLAVIVIAGIVLSALPYSKKTITDRIPGSDFGVPAKGRRKGEPNPLAVGAVSSSTDATSTTSTTPRS